MVAVVHADLPYPVPFGKIKKYIFEAFATFLEIRKKNEIANCHVSSLQMRGFETCRQQLCFEFVLCNNYINK